MPTALPTLHAALGVQRSKDHALASARERSCAILPSRMAADSRSVSSERRAMRAELPQPLRQRATSVGSVSARQDIEQHSLHLAVQRFDVPAPLKASLEQFKYHIPVLQKWKCPRIKGHIDYINKERKSKGIVHRETGALTHKFGSCVKSQHTLGVPSGTGLLVQKEL